MTLPTGLRTDGLCELSCPVDIDTVRLFTDELNEQNFSDRCFDNLSIEFTTNSSSVLGQTGGLYFRY